MTLTGYKYGIFREINDGFDAKKLTHRPTRWCHRKPGSLLCIRDVPGEMSHQIAIVLRSWINSKVCQ